MEPAFTTSRRTLAALLLAIAAALPHGASAAGAKSEARLLAGWAEPNGRTAALLVELAPGWKTYWRAPGEAGVPPVFDWTGSENLASAEVEWPAPRAFDSFGLTTLGYSGRMLLPLRLKAIDPAAPIRLRLSLLYGVCEEVCLPEAAEMALEIAPDAPTEAAAEIGAALGALPLPAAGVVAARCEFGPDRVTARLDYAAPPGAAPLVVAEGPDAVSFGSLESRLDGGGAVATGSMRVAAGGWLDRSALRLTLIDRAGGPAYAIEGCPAS